MRRARGQEAALLTRIARAAKAHWGYPEEWLALWREQLLIDAAYIRTHLVLVATCAEQPAGFAAVEFSDNHCDAHASAPASAHASAPANARCELAHLWITPYFMRRGIGRSLFNAVISAQELQGCTTVRIVSDPHAREFYLAMGCVQTGSEASDIAGRSLPVLEREL